MPDMINFGRVAKVNITNAVITMLKLKEWEYG